MRRASWCIALALTLTQVGCADSLDAEVLTATLDHLYDHGTDIGVFAPGSVLLLDPSTRQWEDELLRVLRQDSSSNRCHFSTQVYESIASRNSASIDLSAILVPHDGWRFGSEAERTTRLETFSPRTTDGSLIWSFGSLSLPTYSDDGKTAYALIAFTWDLHTVYGEYTLIKAQDGWQVQCREFHTPYV
jgi:hypothetical protein